MAGRTFSRVWWYFLVHIFKIKKVWIDFKRFPRYSKVVQNFTRFYLRKSSCFFALCTFQTKRPHSIISTRSQVLVYTNFSDGRTDGRTDIFRKSFLFSYSSKIYVHVYTYLDYFSNFTLILIKVSIPFFPYGNRYEKSGSISLIEYQDMAKLLKISFGFNFVDLRAIG